MINRLVGKLSNRHLRCVLTLGAKPSQFVFPEPTASQSTTLRW